MVTRTNVTATRKNVTAAGVCRVDSDIRGGDWATCRGDGGGVGAGGAGPARLGRKIKAGGRRVKALTRPHSLARSLSLPLPLARSRTRSISSTSLSRSLLSLSLSLSPSLPPSSLCLSLSPSLPPFPWRRCRQAQWCVTRSPPKTRSAQWNRPNGASPGPRRASLIHQLTSRYGTRSRRPALAACLPALVPPAGPPRYACAGPAPGLPHVSIAGPAHRQAVGPAHARIVGPGPRRPPHHACHPIPPMSSNRAARPVWRLAWREREARAGVHWRRSQRSELETGTAGAASGGAWRLLRSAPRMGSGDGRAAAPAARDSDTGPLSGSCGQAAPAADSDAHALGAGPDRRACRAAGASRPTWDTEAHARP